jgi:hypothetical protein
VKLAGTRYSYYPKVYNNTETYYGSNITVLDKDTILINSVEYALGDIQNIPVYDELSKDSINTGYTSFSYTYQNWREDFPVLTIVDGVITTPASVIYNEGKVNLSTTTDGTNEVYTSYTFRFFSSRQINSFIERTIQDINMISPTTDYGRDSYPPYWEDTIVIGAALRALDALFVSVIFREKLLIFANPEIISNINAYYSRISAAFDMAKTKIKKMHDTNPLGVTGFDTLAPPRVMGSAFRDYIYLKGKAF